MRFKGKVAIVTGGSSGIGKETAKRLVAEGASVVLSGKDEAKLHSAANDIKAGADQVRVLAGDIAKPATGAALVEWAEREFGGLDILVSNAGVFRPKPFIEITEEEYDIFIWMKYSGCFKALKPAQAFKDRNDWKEVYDLGSVLSVTSWQKKLLGTEISVAWLSPGEKIGSKFNSGQGEVSNYFEGDEYDERDGYVKRDEYVESWWRASLHAN